MHSVLSDNHIEKELLLKRRPIDKPDDFVIPVCSTNLPREIFAPLFERCYREYYVGSQVARVHMKSLFWEIIFRLIQIAGEDGDHKEVAHPHILRAIRYIKENYNKHLTVAELATKYELSPKYFGKLFHQTTGKSVNAFILDLRIFAAKEMLMGTDLSLDEIAAEIGFCDAFYFSNCFKKAEGIAPSNYRIVMQKK